MKEKNRLAEQRHKLKIRWNFFATSHGKGPVDGIGGSAKRHVWLKVKNRKNNRKNIVQNAAQFAEAAEDMPSVNVFDFTPDEIDSRNKELIEKYHLWEEVPPVPGISKAHFMAKDQTAFISDDVDTHRDKNAQDHDDTDFSAQDDANNPNELQKGNWVIVIYDNKKYPGEIKSLVGRDYLISVMVAVGTHWRWPDEPDTILYTSDNIDRKISFPVPVNTRGHYSFKEI